jgi:hypothetical protein
MPVAITPFPASRPAGKGCGIHERQDAMNTRCSVAIALFLFTFWAPVAQAQMFSGRLVSSFYTWEQSDTVGSSSTYLRAYQVAQLSYKHGDFSLNTYLQGALNATNAFGDLGRIRAYNLYLRWANIGDVLDLDVGRQAIYAGVGNGTIDGVLLRAKFLQNKLRFIGYWGATVDPRFTGVQKNWHDNQAFGGQIITTAVRGLRLGVSYMNRREEREAYATLRARDTTFEAYPYYISNDSRAYEVVSGDAYYIYKRVFSLYGRYDYDVNFSKTGRAQGGARVNLTDALTLTGDYIYRSPRISYNSIFSAFVDNSVSEVEGGVEYGFTPLVRAFARYARVTYTGAESNRWTVGVNNGYGSISYSGSDGYAGQLQSFNLTGSYPLMENMLVPTLGFNFASYRLSPEDDRIDALSFLVGLIVRPMRNLWFDGQLQWLTNSVYNRDLRLQLKLTYWFAQRF